MIPISSTRVSSSNRAVKTKSISFVLTFILFALSSLAVSSEQPDENQVLTVIQKMESAFKTLEDYTCDVEQTFYQDGVESQHYEFKFYFKKKKEIRVDFFYPYSKVTIFYTGGDKEATVMPFRFMPSLKFRFSIDNPLIKTLAGQRIDQTDMGHFIDFMLRNVRGFKQGEDGFKEDKEQVRFLFWARDYIEDKTPEKYRISISKKYWLPIRIERFSLEDKPIETTDIKNYALNVHLKDKLFLP
jgi:outer membrane lipoprotein-sorting protein